MYYVKWTLRLQRVYYNPLINFFLHREEALDICIILYVFVIMFCACFYLYFFIPHNIYFILLAGSQTNKCCTCMIIARPLFMTRGMILISLDMLLYYIDNLKVGISKILPVQLTLGFTVISYIAIHANASVSAHSFRHTGGAIQTWFCHAGLKVTQPPTVMLRAFTLSLEVTGHSTGTTILARVREARICRCNNLLIRK